MLINENGIIKMDEKEAAYKAEYIKGLREYADWLETVPIPAPDSAPNFTVYSRDKEHLLAIRRTAGLKEKNIDSDYVRFIKRFSGNVKYYAFCGKELTCERVKIGERVIPARPAMMLEAQPEKVEEIFEWVCPESLLQ